jgi:hypothetical protein
MKGSFRSVFVFLLVTSLAAACSRERSGPKPQVDEVDPALVCTEQFYTVVTLSGSGFSPVTVHSLTEGPLLALPAISLSLSSDLQGGAATGGP